MNTETDYWLQIRLPACHRLLLMRMFLFWSAADSSRSSTFQSYSVWIFEIICSLVSSMFTFDRSPWIPKSDTLGTSLNYLLKLELRCWMNRLHELSRMVLFICTISLTKKIQVSLYLATRIILESFIYQG